mgnify:CR=1 FL=1
MGKYLGFILLALFALYILRNPAGRAALKELASTVITPAEAQSQASPGPEDEAVPPPTLSEEFISVPERPAVTTAKESAGQEFSAEPVKAKPEDTTGVFKAVVDVYAEAARGTTEKGAGE